MSVESSTGSAVSRAEERVRRVLSWYRVPLVAAAVGGLIVLMNDKTAFWWGAPVALAGEMIQVWAASQLHKNTRFTVSGPYAHVRNPMYIGRFFLGLGLFIMTWNPYLTAAYVILFALYAQGRVRREEQRLEVIFQPDYQHYCSEVRRWLPRLRPYSKAEPRRASWKQVCVNHEQLNLLGLIVVLALIYLRIDRFPDWPSFLR